MKIRIVLLCVMMIGLINSQILPCPTADCLKESIATETCIERANQWPKGAATPFAKNYSRNIDFSVLGGRIIAYKIRWSSGWSGWFVPDYNDIDIKYTTSGGKKWVRRRWSYFADHVHTYIICLKSGSYIP